MYGSGPSKIHIFKSYCHKLMPFYYPVIVHPQKSHVCLNGRRTCTNSSDNLLDKETQDHIVCSCWTKDIQNLHLYDMDGYLFENKFGTIWVFLKKYKIKIQSWHWANISRQIPTNMIYLAQYIQAYHLFTSEPTIYRHLKRPITFLGIMSVWYL